MKVKLVMKLYLLRREYVIKLITINYNSLQSTQNYTIPHAIEELLFNFVQVEVEKFHYRKKDD